LRMSRITSETVHEPVGLLTAAPMPARMRQNRWTTNSFPRRCNEVPFRPGAKVPVFCHRGDLGIGTRDGCSSGYDHCAGTGVVSGWLGDERCLAQSGGGLLPTGYRPAIFGALV